MAMDNIIVRSGAGSYTVVYGRGALGRAAKEIGGLASDSSSSHTGFFLLCSPRVAQHWRAKIEAGIGSRLRETILFDDRERSKNLRTVERIARALVRAGADRRAGIIAAGGGVVGDVAGFAAASFLRGVSLVHIPTTLVAQVDSAIGGKTGVNLPEGKNLVGAFYPPRLVLADPDTLATLPVREYRSGIYEVIKYGVISDTELFAFLEDNLERVVRREAKALDWVIPRCLRAKAEVVGRDERESGLREVLNFGHTFAHALETVTGYRVYRHGEAVGWGMIAAARLSVQAGLLPDSEAQRIEALVRRTGLLPPWPRESSKRLLTVMGADKKTRGGRLRFVLAHQIGRVETLEGIPAGDVEWVLTEMRRTA